MRSVTTSFCFTLGILILFAAAAGASNTPRTGLSPVQKINPQAEHYYDATAIPRHLPSFQKPAGELQAIEPTTLPPESYFCEFVDYSGGNAAYYWTIPDPYGDDYFNMRITPYTNYNCTLLTAYIGIYPPAFVGTPDMQVVVWNDDGFGYPGNELGRVTVPYESLPTGMAYAVVDVSTINGGEPLVFVDGAEFHIGVTTTDQVNDVLGILSDDGSQGQMRSSESWGGMWGLMLDDWGNDVNFLIGADICCSEIPFSECYYKNYSCAPYYYWEQPNAYGIDYYNMRHNNEGRDTITDICLALYEPATVGTPDLDVFIWESEYGYPDLSAVLYQTIVPNGEITYYPDTTIINVPPFLVFKGDYHIGWSTNEASDPSGVLAVISDDGSCGMGFGSFCYEDIGCAWLSMFDYWGVDVNFLIYPRVCADANPLCNTESHYCNISYFWRLPDKYDDVGMYQRFILDPAQYEGCRLETVRLAMYWPSSEAALPLYTHNSEVQVWNSNTFTNLPETKLGAVTLTPADYAIYPDWTEVDFLDQNIYYSYDIWVGVESFAPDTLSGIRILSDDGSCGDLLSCEKYDGTYSYMYDDWGIDVNFVYEIDVCCEPTIPNPCGPPEDWPTSGKDFRRTCYSDNSTGDARCTQALSWMHSDPAGFVYGRPIVYDGIVLAPYNDKLQAFDVDDGTLLWTATGLPEMGSSFRNSVTVHDSYVYYGGGNGRSFTKADVYSGTTVWSRNVLNNPFIGNTVYTTSIVAHCPGTDIVIFGTDAGEVYALDAATGNNYIGWAVNPVMVDGDVLHTLSYDMSEYIYVGTDGAYGTGYGTLYAINVCTGAIEWTMGDGDLYGYEIDGDDSYSVTKEIFQGPIAIDEDGSLYFQTAFNSEVDGAPSGAVYCVLHDGILNWAVPFQFSRFSGPVIDRNTILMTGLRAWTSEGENASWAFRKTSGATVWKTDEAYNAMNWVEGALSCEPFGHDLLYTGNMDAQFMAINADDGSVEFEYNYIAGGSNRGCGVAIDSAGVVMTNRQGDLYVFTEQEERPRLRILKFDEYQSVPFFSPNGYIVTFEDVFMNNGCANLTGTLMPDEAAPAAYAWTVNPGRIARMQRAADNMIKTSYIDMARYLIKVQAVDPSIRDADFAESPYAKDSYSNTGVYAPPVWLNSIMVSSFDLDAGESFNVQYNVNGPLVTRGPQRCYVTIATNDRYFLNDSDLDPTIQLGVLGGCLESNDQLVFGAAEQNVAPVMNTGETGNQNVTKFLFDGNDAGYWQGGLFFAVDQYRLAWTTESWHGGDPDDFWNSLLPDPNEYDQCEPYVTPEPVLLGAMSHDGGMSYDDVYGYVSSVAYIDSVIDFDCYGTGWDWSNVECPYDNGLTMGLRIEERMIGVIGEPAFNNIVIYKLGVKNRNSDPLPGVYVGAFQDFDLANNGFDVWKFDPVHSISWGASCYGIDFTSTMVYGMGKVPMDVDPMIGVRTLDANQAMWNADNVALDSMYYWMTAQPGETYQVGINGAFPCDPGSESDDRDAWFSFVGHDFAGEETYTFGVYLFGFNDADVTDGQFYADLAARVNQICGFDRGDINDDGAINLADVIAEYNFVNGFGPGPLFAHLADVNEDGLINSSDIIYLADYYFCIGEPPVGAWVIPPTF